MDIPYRHNIRRMHSSKPSSLISGLGITPEFSKRAPSLRMSSAKGIVRAQLFSVDSIIRHKALAKALAHGVGHEIRPDKFPAIVPRELLFSQP